jgi:hypothetical protein
MPKLDRHTFRPKQAFPRCRVNIPDPSIRNLNLNRILTKAVDARSGYGWSPDFAAEISDLYRVFLFLCKRYPRCPIVPPREVDELWHLHILDTRNYIRDCQRIFRSRGARSYLHHFPYAGLEGHPVSEEEENRWKSQTLELVEKHFPEFIESPKE